MYLGDPAVLTRFHAPDLRLYPDTWPRTAFSCGTRAYAAAVSRWERIGAHLERAYTLLLLPARAAEGHAELAARGLPPPPG